jgi:hypothetical protein
MAYNTAIRGLTAQGNTEFTGMCYSNNDVSFTMTSTEFANPGFKYIVEITDLNTTESYKFYIAPNAVGSGVFNAKTIFNQLIKTNVTIDDTDDILLQITEPILVKDNLVNRFTIDLYEGYEVAGVFTEDLSVAVQYTLMCVYGKGKSNYLVMGTASTPPIALSQYYDNTLGFGNETVATRIDIPSSLQSEVINWQRVSRSNVKGAKDSAYKILSFIADDGTYINDNYPYRNITHIKYNLFDGEYNGVAAFLIPITFDDGAIVHIPAGLKNLIEGVYIDQDDADDTIFWTIAGYDEEAGDVTAKYGFYIDEDCKHNPVHLYWLNQMGGWDSYSFIKKNERSIDVEKKRYKSYLGNYNTASVETPFDTKNYSRALTEREPIVKTFINLTSDWLTESEYKAMKDLFYSKSVWMVDDNVDGYNILPVVVEDTNYLMKRERNFRKYNQTLRLQLANDYDTINELSSEFPIPSPAPCEFYNVFVTNGGNSALVLQPTVDNTCIINVNAATRDRKINILVRDSLDNTPVGGQTYYIEMNYNFTCTPPIKRLGSLSLGNTSTGGGAIISLEGLQTPETPIIVNAVWGTPITTWNSMFLQLPAFIGTVTGQITIKVGFGNCP